MAAEWNRSEISLGMCDGAFHHVAPKHLRRYTNGFAGRLSDKNTGAVEKMDNVL